MREIILDTETTGLDPKSGDRIVEIGCVELVNRFPTGNNFHEYINPGRAMPEEAYRVHGLGDEFLADKPVFSTLAEAFLSYVGDATLVIHNASFDMGFINYELKAVGRAAIPQDQVLDTLALARRKHPGSPNSLDALCKRYRIDNAVRTKHGALLDAELLADVYLALIGAEQGALDLAASARKLADVRGATNQMRPRPLPSRLTPEERERHRTFIATIGAAAIWLSSGSMKSDTPSN